MMPSDERKYIDDHYTDRDLDEVAADPNFMAAARVYSLDLLTMGEAVARSGRKWPFTTRNIGELGYRRLLHEAADRIVAGTLQAPPQWMEMLSASGDAPGKTSLVSLRVDSCKYSSLLIPELKKQNLALWRQEYTPDDISELIRDRHFVALIDAYQKDLISPNEVAQRYMGRENIYPRDLSHFAFVQLALEIGVKIRSGVLKVPAELESEFPSAYLREPRTRDPMDGK